MMEQSKFYRWRPAEATLDWNELVFKNKIQFTYPFAKKAIVCEIN